MIELQVDHDFPFFRVSWLEQNHVDFVGILGGIASLLALGIRIHVIDLAGIVRYLDENR